MTPNRKYTEQAVWTNRVIRAAESAQERPGNRSIRLAGAIGGFDLVAFGCELVGLSTFAGLKLGQVFDKKPSRPAEPRLAWTSQDICMLSTQKGPLG